MPQPLSRVRKNGRVDFTVNALNKRPRSASLIAQTITAWSYAEVQFGILLASMLKANVSATIEMYTALKGFGQQRDLLVAAARTMLKEKDMDLLTDILVALKGRGQRRHDFAHGIWGVAEILPEAVVLAEAKLFWRHRVAVKEHYQKRGRITSEPPTIPRNKMLVYTESELTEIVELAYEASDIVGSYVNMIVERKGLKRTHMYNVLYNLASIQAVREQRIRRSCVSERATDASSSSVVR